MFKGSKPHKDKIRKFIAFTCAHSEADAVKYLTQHPDIETAVGAYFDAQSSSKSSNGFASKKGAKPSKSKIEKIFRQYEDPESETLYAESMQRFFRDLGVGSTDVMFLLLCYIAKGEDIFEWTQEEFVACFQTVGAATIEQLKGHFPRLKFIIKDSGSKAFREFYQWVYDINIDKDAGWEALPNALAIEMWRIALSGRWKLLDSFLEYAESKYKYAVPKDTWALVLDFIVEVNEDLDSVSELDGWPILIDGWIKDRKQAGNPDGESQTETSTTDTDLGLW